MNAGKFRQRLTIRHLRLIEGVGRELSMSRCAQVLHTSQSAISCGLSEIEDLLGARLFDRTTRRIVPTSLGQILIWHSDQILGQLARAEADFDALSRGVRGFLAFVWRAWQTLTRKVQRT
ncbi:LysR family transcriptional regulator [Bradyrhizobium sp. ISRA442]|uniref:LysR family transcriptional regulator n=1 Tax=Bradyrhizobium sp. ISRA442 TaxID=2866197 RepID=UPI00404AE46F